MSAPASRARLALAVACAATFLSFLDTTVTNLAVPSISSDFGVDVTAVAWIASAYVIPFAAFLAPAGVLADAVGRTRLFRLGVAVFTVCSLAIAVAPTYEVLLAGRAIQGLGAALMIPSSLALVLAEVPAEKRRGAIGLWSAAGALAAAVGPAVGGVVIEALDWRALFCLNLPIGIAVLAAARPLAVRDTRSGRLPDLFGGVLLAAAVGGVIYGLTEAPDRGWSAPAVLIAFAAGVLGVGVSLARASRHERPAIRLDLLRNRSFAAAAGTSMIYGIALFSTMLLGVLLLVGVWSYSPLSAGLAVTPVALVIAGVGVGIGRLPIAIQPRRMIVVGALVQGASTALLALTVSSTPHFLTVWLPLGILMGVGVGLLTVGISTAATMAAPPVHFAAATGLTMAARQLGGALGIAALAVLLAEVDATTPERPYITVYWFVTIVALLAAAVGCLVRRPEPAPSAAPAEATRTQR